MEKDDFFPFQCVYFFFTQSRRYQGYPFYIVLAFILAHCTMLLKI